MLVLCVKKKKIKSVFNENTNQFCVLKKIRSKKFRSIFSLKRSLTMSIFWEKEKSQTKKINKSSKNIFKEKF